MNLDLHRLEVFCKVIETKSFTKAGERMFLSQPTVSEHIRYLEEMIGEKLIDRMGKEALPTQAGLILYEYAKKMIDLKTKTIQALEQFKGSFSGTLKIGASNIPGNYILPELIGKFKKSFSSVRIKMSISSSEIAVKMLMDGEVEIAFTGATWHNPRLEWQKIWQDTLVLAVDPSNPLALKGSLKLEDLYEIPLILREEGSGTRKVTEEMLDKAGIDLDKLKIVAELGSTESVKEGVKASVGASIISLKAIQEEVKTGQIRMVPIEGLDLVRPFYIVTHKKRYLSPLAKQFKEFILSSS